ncbi:unnamed protein product [Musa acuminata var. zebrina]
MLHDRFQIGALRLFISTQSSSLSVVTILVLQITCISIVPCALTAREA